MAPTEPVTTGELVRRFDRMESVLMEKLNRLDSEFITHQLYDSHARLMEEKLKEMRKDLDEQAVTRRQIIVGFALIVLGEIAALTIGLTNFAARVGIQ